MLEKLCSVKKEDFDEIFDDFFIIRNLDQNDFISKLDTSKIYKNFTLKKIEIKKGINYNDFISKILKKLNEFYYDGNRKKNKDNSDLKEAKGNLNQYYPKNGMLVEDFLITNFNGIPGKDCIDENDYKIKDNLNNNTKQEIINFLQTKTIKIENIIPKKKYIYIVKGKIHIKTSEQILGHLHGDIGEFILFFLTESALGKPILFSKVLHSKSASQDKVKGSDGIHIDYEDGKPSFVFLEAKMKRDFDDCVKEVISSHETFLQKNGEANLDNEIAILFANTDTINAGGLGFIFQNDFEKYINPYRRKEIPKDELPFSLVSGVMYENISAYDEKSTIGRIQKVLEKYKSIENVLLNRKVTIFLFPSFSQTELLKNFLEQIHYER